MGYFSNGSDNEYYEREYCERCQHYPQEGDELGCAIMDLHWLYNYDECNKKDSFLHALIPRDKKGYNEQCRMFLESERRIEEIGGK